MRKLFILPLFLTIITSNIFCQGIYFKASSNYSFSTCNQQMPEYFSYQIELPTYMGTTESYYNVNTSSNEFSISSGLNFQGTAGYSINDFLSFELKFSAFNNSKTEFDASPELKYAANGNTDWVFHNYSLLPTVLFGQTFNKSTVNIFFYSGLGISKLNIKASLNENFREYEFDKNYTFSWGYGLEYDYSISKNFSFFTNIGINNTNYKPEKSELISSSFSMDYLTTSQKEIQYVDKITNLELGYNGSSVSASPEIRLKEVLKLNSVFLGIGIKYMIKK